MFASHVCFKSLFGYQNLLTLITCADRLQASPLRNHSLLPFALILQKLSSSVGLAKLVQAALSANL